MIDLSKFIDKRGSQVEKLRKDFRRRRSSPEWAREQAVNRQVRDSDGDSVRARETFGGQWRIQLALTATFAIPDRFTVSRQKHLIHG